MKETSFKIMSSHRILLPLTINLRIHFFAFMNLLIVLHTFTLRTEISDVSQNKQRARFTGVKRTSRMDLFRKKSKKQDDKNNIQSIGTPFAVKHDQHVGFDPATGQFTGLSPEMKAILGSSGISSNDISENSDAVLKVLNFQERMLKNNGEIPKPSFSQNTMRRQQVGGGKQAPAPPQQSQSILIALLILFH